jgi:hypothetical protein
VNFGLREHLQDLPVACFDAQNGCLCRNFGWNGSGGGCSGRGGTPLCSLLPSARPIYICLLLVPANASSGMCYQLRASL